MLSRAWNDRSGPVASTAWLAISLTLAGLPAVLSAQGYDLEPGDRVRVSIYRVGIYGSSSPSIRYRTEGILLTQSVDSLYLVVAENADTVALSLGSGMKVEAASGEAGHTWLGVAVGGFVGMLAGAVVVGVEPNCKGDLCGVGAAAGAMVGLVAGATFGGIVGSQIKKDRWTIAPRVGPAPGGSGAGVGVSIRF